MVRDEALGQVAARHARGPAGRRAGGSGCRSAPRAARRRRTRSAAPRTRARTRARTRRASRSPRPRRPPTASPRPCAAARRRARAAAAGAARPATRRSPPRAAGPGGRARSARAARARRRRAGSSSESSTMSISSRRRSAIAHILIAFDVLLDARRAARHRSGMASWSEFAAAAPELAERVQALLDAHKHKTIATLRRDGSPRISGTESALRGRRADDRIDVAGAQGARPAARPALRAAHRVQRAGRLGRRREARGPRRGDTRRRPRSPRTDSGSTCARCRWSGSNEKRDGLVIDVWTADGGVRRIERK